MTQCQAAVATSANSDFSIQTVTIDGPRAGEVLVRIAGVGVCHTDLVMRDQWDDLAKPAVLGHEGSGVIEVLGEGVEGFAIGDKVLLGFSSCGQCHNCAKDLPSYCVQFVPLNYSGFRLDDSSTAYSDGDQRISSHFFGQSSFATLAVVRAGNLVKVNDTKLPLEILGPLGCGFQTGAGAVMRAMDAQAGSTLIVFGGGPVGLAAVMAGAIRECARVILVEPVAARRDIALGIGATHTIDPAAGDLAAAIQAIAPEGTDFALDTTGNVAVIETGLATLGLRGTFGIVGVPKDMMATASFNIVHVMGAGQKIMGIIEGDSDQVTFIPELLEHQAAGQFPFEKLITTFPLSQINEAIAAQARGDCIKVVLIP